MVEVVRYAHSAQAPSAKIWITLWSSAPWPLNLVLGAMTEEIQAAKLTPLPKSTAPMGIPEVINVSYDLWLLRITLDFPDWDGIVYVDFEAPRGFRVLDEGDLLEMWVNERPQGEWLFSVEANGWAAQEDERPGFIAPPSDQTEFLVAGINDCVSVLGYDKPTIRAIAAGA